jgi:wyosine [tRNA(Phe)-imidazoG37] synthetase (radical SAM superfamily)
MLVSGVNDGEDTVTEVATFLGRLRPKPAYVAIPTRPPAEPWAHAPDEGTVNRAYEIVSERVDHVEHLIGYEGNAFASTGDVEEDLLSITAVHPMREDAIRQLLERRDADWAVVHRLVAKEQLAEVKEGDQRFYLRRFHKRAKVHGKERRG